MLATDITLVVLIAACTIGQGLLVISVLAQRASSMPSQWFLLALFVALICLQLQPIAHVLYPSLEAYSMIIMLPALLSLAPLLHVYVVGMTSKHPWSWQDLNWQHFILPALGAVLAVAIAALPNPLLLAILSGDDSDLSPYMGTLMIMAFALVMSWVVQSICYLFSIFHRLKLYRAQLAQHYANNDKRNMFWMTTLVLALFGLWIFALLSILLDNLTTISLMTPLGMTSIVFVLGWSLGLCAIHQRPGFEDEFLNAPLTETNSGDESKYQRSALDDAQSLRMVHKLESLMEEQQLYLDADLSLSKLSQVSGISANYLSQILNQTIGKSFFDYINEKRIDYAKIKLSTSQLSIVDIAFDAGFNARSSFYKAFKQYTNKTPSQFRRENP